MTPAVSVGVTRRCIQLGGPAQGKCTTGLLCCDCLSRNYDKKQVLTQACCKTKGLHHKDLLTDNTVGRPCMLQAVEDRAHRANSLPNHPRRHNRLCSCQPHQSCPILTLSERVYSLSKRASTDTAEGLRCFALLKHESVISRSG